MTLKFKAYDPSICGWYQPEEVFICDGNVYLDDEDFDELIQNNNVLLFQSTGLMDKNEKEIFEGDILRGNYGEFFYNYVYYDADKAKFMRDDIELWENVDELEVAGNLFDNPELSETVERQDKFKN